MGVRFTDDKDEKPAGRVRFLDEERESFPDAEAARRGAQGLPLGTPLLIGDLTRATTTQNPRTGLPVVHLEPGATDAGLHGARPRVRVRTQAEADAAMRGRSLPGRAKEFLISRPAEAADTLRDAFVDLLAPSEQEIEEAAAGGDVPYGKILRRTAADVVAEGVPLTPTEIALYAGLGAAGKKLAAAAPALARRFPKTARILTTPLGRGYVDRVRAGGQAAANETAEAALLAGDTPAAQPAAAAADDVPMIFEQPPEPGTGLPRVRPLFDSAKQREQLVQRGILEKEGQAIQKRLVRLKTSAERIKEIKAGDGGPLPEDARAAAAELRLVEKDAVREIESLAKSLQQGVKDARGGPSTLEEFVLDAGGVRHYKPDPITKKIDLLEEWKEIPRRFRASMKQGLGQPMDELAQNAYDAHLLDAPTESALIAALRKIPDRPRTESWRAFLPEAEHLIQDPEAKAHLAVRYLQLREKVSGPALPGVPQPAVRSVRKAISEAELQREIEKVGLEWETNRAKLAGKTTIRTQGADVGPTPEEAILGVTEAEGAIPAREPMAFAGNIRLSKFADADVREGLREWAQKMGMEPGQPFGGRRSMQETDAMARQLLQRTRPEDVLRIPAGTALNAEEIRGVTLLANDVRRRAVRAQNAWMAEIGQPGEAAALREAELLLKQADDLTTRLSEFKTTSGRAVQIQKGVAEAEDLPAQYLEKLSQSEQVRRLPSGQRLEFMSEHLSTFQRMTKEQQLELLSKEDALSAGEEFVRRWNATVKPGLNLWRASLVSQLATALRNFTSQAGAAVWNVLDDAVAATIEAPIRMARGEAPRQAFRKASSELVEDFVSFFRQFTPADRKVLNGLMASDSFKPVREMLVRTPISSQEAAAGQGSFAEFSAKAADFLTTLSRWGEHQQRLYFFEADFRAKLRRAYPELVKTMDFKSLPWDQMRDVTVMAADAADKALRLTFSRDFNEGVAGGIIKALNLPVVDVISAAGGATFPRFMANAYSWLWRHGPGIGLLETLATSSGRRGLAAGNPESAKAVAGAVTGTMGLAAALYVRSNEKLSAGSRFYEIRMPNGKFLNVLAYNPIIAPYLFMAELGLNGTQNLNARDIQQGLLMVRVAGLGRFGLDFLSGNLTGERASRLVQSAAGEFLGGFFTPLQTLKDFVAGFSAEERKMRDTRQNPIIGPVIAKVPYLSRILPEAVSPTRGAARENESPWLRQMSGFTVTDKNALEQRLDEIAYPVRNLYPKYSDARANWLVTRELGKIAEARSPELLRRLDQEVAELEEKGLKAEAINEIQRQRIEKAYGFWKEVARRKALRRDPALFRRIAEERAGPGRRIVAIRKAG